jgi:hypothetical protein
MNKTIFTAMAITALTLSANTAFAGGPKTSLAHCGCNADATDLEWQIINVSRKSKGHQQHLANDMETCVVTDDAGVIVMQVNFERAESDCIISGSLENVGNCPTAIALPEQDESCT